MTRGAIRPGGAHRLRGLLGAAALLAALASSAGAAATITIINMDGPGVGFNDPTAAVAVGGNPGTTVGAQRLNCFTQAANIWGSIISSTVPIQIQAAFTALPCDAGSATLGSAGPRFVEFGVSGLEFPDYWYHEALACKEAGFDLVPAGTIINGQPDNGSDINAQFNVNLGQANCLPTSGWYYGFDHNEGTKIDLLAVLLHEFAHGFGFSTTTNGANGAYFGPAGGPFLPALWDRFLLDETQGLHWDQNTAAQRAASAVNAGHLVWDGQQVSFQAPLFLSHAAELGVPFGAGVLPGNAASFGGALTQGGLTARAIVVADPVAPASDGCNVPFTNAAALVGRIAVIDRGTCTFTTKARNAQNAGAVGCILINNAPGGFSPSGTDTTITIPVLALSQADGASLKTAINAGPTTVTMRLNATQFAGLSANGHVLMYAPSTFVGGSSVSHWDISAAPNLLMEPAINPDLTSSVDLTDALFRDIGWMPRLLDAPPAGADARVAIASRPNPARGAADVQFSLAADERVELTLYDVSGRTVRSLAKGSFAAGPHVVHWDGLDASGRRAAPGIYLMRLRGARSNATHSLILMD